ncbi:MAG: glycoside hydrolase family 28 protein, partial [Bryobacteraceae bacterium]
RLDRCPGAIVRDSRAFAGTGTFLSVGPGELKKLIFVGNTLMSARRPAVESRTDYWRETEPATEAEPAVRHR